jgi:23S rRNA (adenine2503-C2)-methyltransferase
MADYLNIKNLTPMQITAALAEMGEQRHRARQIMHWIWQKGATSFDEMTSLSLGLRARLNERFRIPRMHIAGSLSSARDGSQKFLLECEDGAVIETVLMEARGIYTICVSSQIGCPLSCSFCRTGTGGLERDLTTAEILDQILYFRLGHIPPRRRFNIVFMGMGDPLLNTGNVFPALEILNHQDGFALREKRITVSTIGFPDRIRELESSGLRAGLAVSLNAVDDATRRILMPAAAGIEETLAAAERYAINRKMRTTLEYVLIAGVNDRPEDARGLASLTSGRPFKINIIPFNEWKGCSLRRPGEEAIDSFVKILLPSAPAVTVRRSQGGDIGAACGQLRADREEYGL